MLFLFIVASGIYMWFPRRWTSQTVKAVLLFKPGVRGKARDFNWHNVIGIWSAVPLLIVVASAVPISFPWGNNLVYRMVGEEPPAPRGGGRGGGEGAEGAGRAGGPGRAARPGDAGKLGPPLRSRAWQGFSRRRSGRSRTGDRSTSGCRIPATRRWCSPSIAGTVANRTFGPR